MQHSSRRTLCAVAGVGILLVMVVLMRVEGRVWWCGCGSLQPWIGGVWNEHTSQHLVDPYSFTHFSHGLILWGLLCGTARRILPAWRAVLAMGLEAAWEVAENSPWIIERYRTATADIGYSGDSILNAVGDLACCQLGVAFAARFSWKMSLAVLVLLEVVLVVWVRDSLALNILMLACPIEAIREWQRPQ
ncbi:MAG: DUF2585 family protein [Planctomycetaceae bacterium]|nr:DUF2585 family protein [Planctomycetaceae bacterium]